MTDRTALGAADVADHDLAAMLQADAVLSSSAREIDYDLEAMTTGGRWWVDGTVQRGSAVEPFQVVVKVAQTVLRSPVMAYVPPEYQAMATANLPWRVEPDVYLSDLAVHLPDGARAPRCLGVRDLDEESAAIWMEAVTVVPTRWTIDHAARTAHLLGRLAASPAVQEVADRVGHSAGPRQARVYLEGRLEAQFLTAYRDGGVFEHPVVARHVSSALQARLLALVELAPALVEEIEALPLLAAHGDACPNNLLADAGGTVVIDWAFFGRNRVGFDLSQLLLAEIELGRATADDLPERRAAVLDAYRDGLAAEGTEITAAALGRAQAIQAAIAIGIAAVPLERLGEDQATLDPLMRERARMLDQLLTAIDL